METTRGGVGWNKTSLLAQNFFTSLRNKINETQICENSEETICIFLSY